MPERGGGAVICIETTDGVGTTAVWGTFLDAVLWLDIFQTLGVPCWLSPMLLDNPNEPEAPFSENE
jgi:hypothetical protein